MRELAGGVLQWRGKGEASFDLSLQALEKGWAYSSFQARHPEQLLMRNDGFAQAEPMLTVMVMLEGRLVSHASGESRPVRLQAGQLCLYSVQEHVGATCYEGATTDCVSVLISLAEFEVLLSPDLDQDLLKVLVQMRVRPAFMCQAPAPASLLQLARRLQALMAGQGQGLHARLQEQMLRAQFIIATIDGLRKHQQAESEKLARWRRQDEFKLRAAGAALLDTLQEPPTIAELARLVALNDCRLKVGFKAMFGLSIAAWVREQRLQQAARLLKCPRMRVTEAALQCGYANPAQFAAAFRKRFALKPSEWALGWHAACEGSV